MDQLFDLNKFEVECHYPGGWMKKQYTITYLPQDPYRLQHLYARFNHITCSIEVFRDIELTQPFLSVRKYFLRTRYEIIDNMRQRIGYIQGCLAVGSKYVFKDTLGKELALFKEQIQEVSFQIGQVHINSGEIFQGERLVGTIGMSGDGGRVVSINLSQYLQCKLDRRFIIVLAIIYEHDIMVRGSPATL